MTVTDNDKIIAKEILFFMLDKDYGEFGTIVDNSNFATLGRVSNSSGVALIFFINICFMQRPFMERVYKFSSLFFCHFYICLLSRGRYNPRLSSMLQALCNTRYINRQCRVYSPLLDQRSVVLCFQVVLLCTCYTLEAQDFCNTLNFVDIFLTRFNKFSHDGITLAHTVVSIMYSTSAAQALHKKYVLL